MDKLASLSEQDLCDALKQDAVSVLSEHSRIWSMKNDLVLKLIPYKDLAKNYTNARAAKAVGLNPVRTEILEIDDKTYDLFLEQEKKLGLRSGNKDERMGVLLMEAAKGIRLQICIEKLDQQEKFEEKEKLFQAISPKLLVGTTLTLMEDAHTNNIYIDGQNTTVIDYDYGVLGLHSSVEHFIEWDDGIDLTQRMIKSDFAHYQIKFNPDQLIKLADDAKDNFLDIVKKPDYADLQEFSVVINQRHKQFVDVIKEGWQPCRDYNLYMPEKYNQ